MMQATSSRRRFLTIAAVAGAAASIPRWAWSSTALANSDWQGTALGAPASERHGHQNRRLDQRSSAASVHEINRLEHIFRLYQSDSEIRRLHRTGQLVHPPQE